MRSPRIAKAPCPIARSDCAGLLRRPVVSAAQARMRPLGVVVAAPAFEDGAGMRQRAEPGLVQKLVTVVAAGSAAETWNVTMSDRS
jgi:hypothetical protein